MQDYLSAESVDLYGAFLPSINWFYCIPSVCVHFLWVHILCCFINRASNAPVDKAREHGAGRHPLFQSLLFWLLGLRPSFMKGLYNRAMMGEWMEIEKKVMWGI